MNAGFGSKRGFAGLKWHKLCMRNEALDCPVYASAAARMIGADRWSEAHLADIEEQVAADSKADGVKTKPPPDSSVPQSAAAQVRPWHRIT
jgi:phage terminase large subunit GpA-like protein